MVSYVYQKITECYQQNAPKGYSDGDTSVVRHDPPMSDEDHPEEKADHNTDPTTDPNNPRMPFSWKNDVWKNKHVRGWAMFSATFGAMIFAGVLVCQNGKLVDNSNQTLRHQIGVDSILIDNSQRTVRIADSTMRIGNRAYVVVDTVFMTKDWAGERLTANVSMRNVGNTPAYHMQVYGMLSFGIWNFAQVDYIFTKTSNIPAIDLGSGKPHEQEIYYGGLGAVPISDSLARAVQSGAEPVAFGAIRYFDIFWKEHRVHFCYNYKSGK
ncbi:MAG TPA: hypothetical protein VES59_02875, partial [Bacteroidota bacterium]|nr:hypothetical protein [Bacteroidota bacterium]